MPEPTNEQWVAIQEHLAAGRMIQAIKVYREASDVGLKEAKDAMEAYLAKLHAEAPDRFPVQIKTGCTSAIVFCIFLAGVFAAAKVWI